MKRPGKAITIKDIAQEAGVSISTVSNVLNGNSAEMREDTLVRVQQIIAKHQYRPNRIARSMITRRTATIGLVLAEIETPLFLQSLNVIERSARLAGFNLLVSHARDAKDEVQSVDLFLEKQVEGVIFLSTSERKDDSHLERLREACVPTILVNRFGRSAHHDQVNWDNRSGVYNAVEYLRSLGHQEIALLTGPKKRLSTQQRLEGYKQALTAHNLPFRKEYLQNGDYTEDPDNWRTSTRILLSLPRPPTAIIASDDIVAAVVIETVRETGRYVPRDISVIGIDDQAFLSFLSLSTIQLPIVEAGRIAVDMLLRRIAEPDIPYRQITLDCPLIKRRTSGPPPETQP
ncbi:MAG: LacI family DNA-binding transcriptional regulator [Anaerolineae bacterium]|nr:LacI family DNA-binding transcriptional regulator [Anaerolineae bacterium]